MWRQIIGTTLAQVMGVDLIGDKPLTELRLHNCHLNSKKHISVKFKVEK